jgi:hypothetical protein
VPRGKDIVATVDMLPKTMLVPPCPYGGGVLIKAQEDLARDRPELGLTTHIKKVGKGRGGEALDARFDMTPGAHFANCSEEPNGKWPRAPADPPART